MDSKVWLKNQAEKEFDILPYVTNNSVFIHEEGKPIAHYSLSKRGKYRELNTLIIDKNHRNKGLTYEILDQCGDSIIVFTRNPFLKRALLKSGYKQIKFPGIITFSAILLDRFLKSLKMIFTLQIRRFFHQLFYMTKYKMYVKK